MVVEAVRCAAEKWNPDGETTLAVFVARLTGLSRPTALLELKNLGIANEIGTRRWNNLPKGWGSKEAMRRYELEAIESAEKGWPGRILKRGIATLEVVELLGGCDPPTFAAHMGIKNHAAWVRLDKAKRKGLLEKVGRKYRLAAWLAKHRVRFLSMKRNDKEDGK